MKSHIFLTLMVAFSFLGYSTEPILKSNPLECLAPTAFSLTNITPNEATLTWTASTSETAGYQYVLITDGSTPDALTVPSGSVSSGITSIVLGGLAENTSYDAYVRTNCGSGIISDWSLVTSFTTLSICNPPTNLSISNITKTTAKVSWDAPSNDTSGYEYLIISDGSTPNVSTLPTGFVESESSQYSDLWGVNGELWDPAGRLPDITNVGYMGGGVPLPDADDWPIGENVVTDHGAVGDGIHDDTQALKNAIAACAPYHAVYLPNGTYKITNQFTIDKNYVVIRGEDMYQTILKFPTGLRDAVGPTGNFIFGNGFLDINGNTDSSSTHRSIENLTFDFPEIPSEGHFSDYGANAIDVNRLKHSWIKNILIKNCNIGIVISKSNNISVINIEFDNYPGRVVPGGGDDGYAGHNGVKINSQDNLVHNVEFKGNDEYEHNIAFNNSGRRNVISRVKGSDMQMDDHGGAAGNNFFTEIDLGEGTPEVGRPTYRGNNDNSIWWNVKATTNQSYVNPDPDNTSVLVGLQTCNPSILDQTDYWHETKSPELLYPQNIYLAQLENLNKPLPDPNEGINNPINIPLEVTLSDLSPDTNYDVYVRSNCVDCTTGDWSVVASFTTLIDCQEASYSGNGNTGFGGPVGGSSLSFSDDGTSITGTFTKGAGDFNDAMVIYISTGATGRSVIDSDVNDQFDPLRRAISQAGSNSSTLSFPSGFQATHAIAIDQTFGGLWSIPATGTVGANELPFIDSVGFPDVNSNTQSSFTFTFDWSDIGLASIDNFSFIITYLNSTNGFLSDEGYGDGLPVGNPGSGNITFNSARHYPYYYKFDGTNWSPSSPDGVTEDCRSALVNSGTATLSNNTRLAKLKVNTQAVLDLDANLTADITFKSDASGTAQLADASAAGIIGEVTVERFIPAGDNNKRAFRFLTSSVNSSGSIFENWQENGSTPSSPDGLGTHISGGAATEGFDQTGTNNPSMFTFSNDFVPTGSQTQNNAWNALPNTNVKTLKAGEAYLTFIRGDRSIDVTSNSATPTNTTLRATGDLHVGSISFSSANNSTTPEYGLSDQVDFYSLVGNPYQAIVDINNLDFANVKSNFYWVWDANLGSQGQYTTVSLPSGLNTTTSSANQFVQPGQSFFVQTIADGAASLTFNEDDKNTSGGATTIFSEQNEPSIHILLYTTNALSTGAKESDGTLINFSDNANNGLDLFDADKFLGPGENLARLHSNELISIENRAMPTDNEILALSTTGYTEDNYTFVVNASNIQSNFEAYLLDNYTGTQTQLNEGLTQINFSVDMNIPASNTSDRFSLVFDNTTLGIDENSFGEDFSLYPNPAKDGNFSIKTQGLNGEDVNIKIHNILGQQVLNQKLKVESNGDVNVTASGLSAGVYLVELLENDKSFIAKLIVE